MFAVTLVLIDWQTLLKVFNISEARFDIIYKKRYKGARNLPMIRYSLSTWLDETYQI
jgi:hypothetical protein